MIIFRNGFGCYWFSAPILRSFFRGFVIYALDILKRAFVKVLTDGRLSFGPSHVLCAKFVCKTV